MTFAWDDDIIATNPAMGVRLPHYTATRAESTEFFEDPVLVDNERALSGAWRLDSLRSKPVKSVGFRVIVQDQRATGPPKH